MIIPQKLMLYVLLREANIKAPAFVLPELQEGIKGIKKLTHVKQQMHVGILSEKSSFYEVISVRSRLK